MINLRWPIPRWTRMRRTASGGTALVVGVIAVLGLIAFGATFQDGGSHTLLSVPSLWLFGLIGFPIIIYLIVRYSIAKTQKAIQ